MDDNLVLHFTKQKPGNYIVRLMNNLGQVVGVQEVKHAVPSSVENIRFPYKVLHGAYQLEISKPDGTKTLIDVLY